MENFYSSSGNLNEERLKERQCNVREPCIIVCVFCRKREECEFFQPSRSIAGGPPSVPPIVNSQQVNIFVLPIVLGGVAPSWWLCDFFLNAYIINIIHPIQGFLKSNKIHISSCQLAFATSDCPQIKSYCNQNMNVRCEILTDKNNIWCLIRFC